MTTAPPSKQCEWCGATSEKRYRMGKVRWESQRYCSGRCLRAAWGDRRARMHRDRVAAAEAAAAAAAATSDSLNVVGYLPLRRRDGTVSAWAKVDGGPTFIRAAAHRWYLGARGYPMRQERAGDKTEAHFLHHLVLGDELSGREVDHVNRDKLDNRRSNLRLLTRGENEQNKIIDGRAASGYRNVYFDRKRGKFFARVIFNGRQHFGGYFTDAAKAGAAARALRLRLHPYAPELTPCAPSSTPESVPKSKPTAASGSRPSVTL